MVRVPSRDARDRIRAAVRNLGRLVDELQASDGVVMIAKAGAPAAVLFSLDEFESIQETIFWLSQPPIREDIAQAERGYSCRPYVR
jgi:antitoxin YefM